MVLKASKAGSSFSKMDAGLFRPKLPVCQRSGKGCCLAGLGLQAHLSPLHFPTKSAKPKSLTAWSTWLQHGLPKQQWLGRGSQLVEATHAVLPWHTQRRVHSLQRMRFSFSIRAMLEICNSSARRDCLLQIDEHIYAGTDRSRANASCKQIQQACWPCLWCCQGEDIRLPERGWALLTAESCVGGIVVSPCSLRH